MLRLKLGAALSWTSFLTEEIRVLSGEYGRTITGFQNHVRKKRQLWHWQKDLIAKRLGSGMRAKSSHQKQKQM